MKKVFLLFFLFVLFSKSKSIAQYYYYNDKYYENETLFEVGGSFGFMNCLTDLGGGKGEGSKFIKDLNWKNFKPCYGAFASVTLKNTLGIRLEYTRGDVEAYDSILSDVKTSTVGRYERYLNFKSEISEFSLVAEVHPLNFFDWGETGPPKFSPYILAGFGFFSFKPQGYINNGWVDLEPLRLEGQGFAEYKERDRYELSQFNIPLGIGVKYELSSLLTLRGELMYRILFTDYLDDVSQRKFIDPALFNNYLSPDNAVLASQLFNRRYEIDPIYTPKPNDVRGNPDNNDSYFSFNIKLGIAFGREEIKNRAN